MPTDADEQVTDLQTAVSNHATQHGARYLNDTTVRSRLILIWMGYLRVSVSRGWADRLLDTAQGALIETAGCLSLGLARAAIFSIRAHMELLMAWIYYNDHPVEWTKFEKSGHDYILHSAILSYMRSHDEKFQTRFRLLIRYKTRSTEDPYGILSIHAHSISGTLGPTIAPLQSLVQGSTVCDEVISLWGEVSEYLTDIFCCWYGDRWQDFPLEVRQHLTSRLPAPDLAEFCR
jgi:hypothetical protein